MIQFYNSLSKKKEIFKPIEDNKLRMYVCGITVYDYCHIGHARSMVVFDVIVKYFRARGYDVTFVRNITDIDDKIINRARENGEPVEKLTARFIDIMHADEQALGVAPPDIEPKATECMAEIVAMIQRLVDKGYAYAVPEGDVYYDVRRFEGYGKLAGRDLEHEVAGARVAVGEHKRDPLDFVLWKRSKPGEPQWDSPWGPGRPGWHIECSAMSTHYLGEHFDIHGGGLDLKFPHHENEIAQSEAATDQPFANYWLHNGMITIDGKKMAKSEGNYRTIEDVLAKYRAETVRYFFLTSHYAKPLDYSEKALEAANEGLTRLYLALREIQPAEGEIDWQHPHGKRFQEVMDDDFNTPAALAVLFDVARDLNRARETADTEQCAQLAGLLSRLGAILGLLQDDPESFLRAGSDDEAIEKLIAERNEARRSKDFARADALRDQLQDMGVVLEDTPGGTKWRRQ